ncbi:MAG: pilus assembly protein PilM [Deltaproteobacteria bacterium]|nr:pilus assembly protein PilM [Deltaproteobacteria bacterium]MDQ3295727.1 pilus assembly protein PilM [Myxococcota bacterium]
MATRMFAVDLGAWSVKLVIASPGIRGATLLHVVERLVPPGDESSPAPGASPGASSSADQRARAVLAGLIDELRLRNETGYIGVFGDQVFTQVIEFPFKNLRRAELEKAVGGELEGVVPVDLEDMVYAFEPLPLAPAAGPVQADAARGRVAPPPDGMRVLSYAMRRDRAEQMIEIGRAAGYDPRGVLACGGAAVRLVERTPSLMQARTDGAVAVIDIGHDRTDLVVVAHGKAVFSRSIGRAGKQVTEAIARHWKLPFEDAERAKHSDGFVASSTEPAPSEQWAKIHQVLIAELQPFARDLRQTLAACRARTGFTAISALVVGGGSRLRGMASFLTEQLGIPAWRLTADDCTALAGPRLGPDAAALPLDSGAMTVGMAYDAAGGRPQFDLRSGSAKMDLSFLRAKAVPIGGAVLAVAAFAAVSAYADLYRVRKAEKVLAKRLVDESAAHFNGEAKSADAILSTTAGGAIAAASPLPKMSAYDILLEISSKVPPKEKITLDIDRLDITDLKVDIDGSVKTPEELDSLVAELKTIKCFKDVQRGPTSSGENNTLKFKLTISSQCM